MLATPSGIVCALPAPRIAPDARDPIAISAVVLAAVHGRPVMRLICLAVVSFLAAETALAHDHWINNGRYKNSRTGELCCGEQDCVKVADQDVKATPAGYLLTTGELVPYNETLKSEDGAYWRCHRFDRLKTRRCFFAPEPASE
jgi:hypothetical protein